MRRVLPAVLGTMLTIGLLAALAQIPTFSVKREEVRIDVLVTDSGRPVVYKYYEYELYRLIGYVFCCWRCFWICFVFCF